MVSSHLLKQIKIFMNWENQFKQSGQINLSSQQLINKCSSQPLCELSVSYIHNVELLFYLEIINLLLCYDC